MKFLLQLFLCLTFLGCRTSNENINFPNSKSNSLITDSTFTESIESNNNSCALGLKDFLKLSDKKLQAAFFLKLDSIRKVQYPDNNQEKSIFVDLTPEYLSKFLSDIDSDSILANNEIEMKYHFNVAPEGYSDPKTCIDDIRLRLDTEFCQFTLIIYNTFLVEPDWCTESAVIYGFNISGNKIIDFWRNEAG